MKSLRLALQKDAGYKSNSFALPTKKKKSCANKHYQILQFPQETHEIFQRPSKTELIATGGSGDQKPSAILSGK